MTDLGRLLYMNGLNAKTGQPISSPVSSDDLAKRVLELFSKEERVEDKASFGLEEGVGPFGEYALDDPSDAGWGLLVHESEGDEMTSRLRTLVEHRNGRILEYSGESVREWKEKNRADAVNPNYFPHYVLIAGSPEKIPFDLQFSLNVLQAVGRVDFDDPDDFACYADMVVRREKGDLPSPGERAVFFAPKHPRDFPTAQSSARLVNPLLDQLPQSVPTSLRFQDLLASNAQKSKLLETVQPDGVGKTPALLFSASHGAAVHATDVDHRLLQGSIVCQDCAFPLTRDTRDGFVTGFDVEDGFALPGGIHFLFACYGVGTRANSDFVRYVPSEKERTNLLAVQGAEDFVSYLPKALLAKRDEGALAVVGHVDPAWVFSFVSPTQGDRRIHPFGFSLARLLEGKPVGFALSTFSQKYSDLSVDLLNIIEDQERTGNMPDPQELSDLWICKNDAQNYMVLGDPAVRLKFA